MLVETAESYIKAIVNKDLEAMEQIFADEIEFFNWNIHAKGKEEALERNRIHLALVEYTKIDILNVTHKEKYVCFETILTHRYIFDVADVFDSIIRGKGTVTTTKIVFIIELNDLNKIKSIRTYKLR